MFLWLLIFRVFTVTSTKLKADIQPLQGPEEGSDPENGRIQVVEGAGGVEFRYCHQDFHIPRLAEIRQIQRPHRGPAIIQ